jgi:hypothetical protein
LFDASKWLHNILDGFLENPKYGRCAHRRRRRRKTRKAWECTVEVHSGVQCAVRRIKQRNKQKNKAREESR